MTIVARPPNPSLIAIILVVRARSGPRFVYHYPPSPLSKSALDRSEDGPLLNEEPRISSDETTSCSDEDILSDAGSRGRRKFKRAKITDEEDEDSSGPGTDDRVPWEHLLGLDATALEKLLMPSDRSWHKRRFEVAFNELVFVGWPIFIRKDGTWRKKRWKEKVSGDKTHEVDVNLGLEVLPGGKHGSHTQVGHQLHMDPTHSVTTDAGAALGEEDQEMTIFNVVFVLNPPVLEYSLRVKEMYDHVVKKLGRRLKWAQARANYVWKQSEIILKAKAQARHRSG